jgi:Ulp1 family protease
LTNNWTGYNFEDARNWSVYFPLNFFERPMLFTINTSPTGSHWVFAIIDPRNPNTRTLIFIDPYHRVTEFARRVVENLNTWYKNEVKLHTNEHIPDLTPQYWNPELPEQPQHDGYNCGVFCAMYQYYLLRYNKFPTREDFTSADMPMLRDFMTHTILNGRHMTI